MATLLLSAAGAAIGGSVGGSLAGLATGVIGRAVGASLGAVIDQKLTGAGSEAVETGRVERFRVMGASEGAPLPRVFGRFRVAGQVIWSSRFLENVDSKRMRGKGGGQSQQIREYSYSISLALAVCEGEVARIGRIWADGQRLDLLGMTWRLHAGSDDQLPDPLIAAIEGADQAPAYRGAAYVVIENLDLSPFGNRIPQFNFEVFRPCAPSPRLAKPAAQDIRGVALVPGTGEYALAVKPVHFERGKGQTTVANVNNDRGHPDFLVSFEQLQAELPRSKAISLVVSWFGDDLRCGRCRLQPAVEQGEVDGREMPWRVAGADRFSAKVVSRVDERPLFGGTPSDASVVQAIEHMHAAGQAVMFYPFILMDILAGNGLADPWTGAADQPPVPWRGRITLSRAPGRQNSPDKTGAAAEEVAAFFGTAEASDFTVEGGDIVYTGPQEWSYRRFILHYAKLCSLIGGVDAFCIGSEMRSLTQVRDGLDTYPAVRAFRKLAEDVRNVVGPGVKIGYAADWSEYFGHHPSDGSGDAIFNLDPLWSHQDIDFVGIDNYMPLSDWRDDVNHLDAWAESIYNLDYLAGNVQGGEGYDWYYADETGRKNQIRLPINDGAYGDDWMFRYKDVTNWWSRPHYDRIAAVKAANPTAWAPRSKPIWFTELGCPAVNKGTNQPNVFFDPKSSESFFPYYSNGARDDLIQKIYLQAVYRFWNDNTNNPASAVYSGRMVDMRRAFVWAWDARPWPDFPDRLETWSDGLNFDRGHWLNARVVLPTLAEAVAEICGRSSAVATETKRLCGNLNGYMIGGVESARQSLQPLMLALAFDSFGQDGEIVFVSRNGRITSVLDSRRFATPSADRNFDLTRSPASDAPGRITLGFVRGDMDYQTGAVEAAAPDALEPDLAQSDVPLVLLDGEAKSIAERWLSETSVARDSIKFDLPPSLLAVAAGDVVQVETAEHLATYRVDRVEDLGHRSIAAVRVEPSIYRSPIYTVDRPQLRQPAAATPVFAEFLDLPLLSGDEIPHAPHVAVAKSPWAGSVAVFSSTRDSGYAFNREVLRPATFGRTLDPLPAATAGHWLRASLRVRLDTGSLQSGSVTDVLNGANAAALRSGRNMDWEIVQFTSAQLTGRNEYVLSGILRGQAGTDGIAPEGMPAGADLVLLDAAVVQLELAASARGLERHYRIGPAVRAYDDPSYAHYVEAFSGVGLRPYRPAHLVAKHLPGGSIALSWIRRSRVDGDGWEGGEPPLSEDQELYRIRVLSGMTVVHEADATTSRFVYPAYELMPTASLSDLTFEVAQVSARFGPGPFAKTRLQ